MASNTQILIKRSSANTKPTDGSIKAGELAYSYASNTLFIGTNDGASTLEIGAWSDLTNLANGTYGSASAVPVITVDQHGKVTNVYTQSISTSFNVSDGTNSNTVAGGTTLTFSANNGFGIQTYVDPTTETVYIGLDNTKVILANTSAYQTIDGTLSIAGELNVTGNVNFTDVETIVAQNSLIHLANNNTLSDVLDIGFFGQSNDGTQIVYTGLFRHAGDAGKDYYLFDGYTTDPEATWTIDPADPSFKISTLHANLVSQNVQSSKFLADESLDTSGGYGFWQDGAQDTGMYSSGDGNLEFKSNGSNNFTINSSSFVHSTDVTLQNGATLGDNSNDAVYFGLGAGTSGNNTVSIGSSAGTTSQGSGSVAVGHGAGRDTQGWLSVAIGVHAAETTQGSGAVAVGHGAAQINQQSGATAVGNLAGKNTQGNHATAIGYRAGYGDNTSQGQYAVALGALAGYTSQHEYSIAINGSGVELNPSEEGFYVDPIRANNAVGGNVTTYNTATKELVSTDVTITNAGITLANGTIISDSESGFFVDSLAYDAAPLDSSNIVLYNASTGEITYGPIADLNPAQLSNGSHTWTVSADTGALYSDRGTYIGCSANSVVIGQNVDLTNVDYGRVAIGDSAGETGQEYQTVAIGNNAGNYNQHYFATAIGYNAGNSGQGTNSVAVGHAAGESDQLGSAVAVGFAAGTTSQGFQAVAVGRRAGRNYQGDYATAIGPLAGQEYQSNYAVAMGYAAGQTYQGNGAVAIGDNAGNNYQSTDSIAIGSAAGQNSANTNGWAPIAIGRYAGKENAGSQSISLGNNAGNTNVGYHAIAIGHYAGASGTGESAIVIGDSTGSFTGNNTVVIGNYAGFGSGDYSVVLGHQAANGDDTALGQYAIAIGYRAGFDHGSNNSIVLNASGSDLSADYAGFYVNPIRYTEAQDATYDGLMFYNADTSEVRYSYTLDGGSF